MKARRRRTIIALLLLLQAVLLVVCNLRVDWEYCGRCGKMRRVRYLAYLSIWGRLPLTVEERDSTLSRFMGPLSPGGVCHHEWHTAKVGGPMVAARDFYWGLFPMTLHDRANQRRSEFLYGTGMADITATIAQIAAVDPELAREVVEIGLAEGGRCASEQWDLRRSLRELPMPWPDLERVRGAVRAFQDCEAPVEESRP